MCYSRTGLSARMFPLIPTCQRMHWRIRSRFLAVRWLTISLTLSAELSVRGGLTILGMAVAESISTTALHDDKVDKARSAYVIKVVSAVVDKANTDRRCLQSSHGKGMVKAAVIDEPVLDTESSVKTLRWPECCTSRYASAFVLRTVVVAEDWGGNSRIFISPESNPSKLPNKVYGYGDGGKWWMSTRSSLKSLR